MEAINKYLAAAQNIFNNYDKNNKLTDQGPNHFFYKKQLLYIYTYKLNF